jgi:excisionase family DNA binding protein
MQEKHLTVSEVAGRWRVHRATVLRMYHDGIIAGIPVCSGKSRATVRFRLATIEAWEKARERVSRRVVEG